MDKALMRRKLYCLKIIFCLIYDYKTTLKIDKLIEIKIFVKTVTLLFPEMTDLKKYRHKENTAVLENSGFCF